MEIGLKIRELRRLKNWTQDQLADQLDLKKQMISNYETGQNKPTLEKLQKMSEIFEVDLISFVDSAVQSKVESDTWAQKTVDQMQERINALEADKKYLQDLLQMAVAGKGNFLKGNVSLFPLFNGGSITPKLAA